jgi:hypothetical protein
MEQSLEIGARGLWVQDVLVLEAGAGQSQGDALEAFVAQRGSDVYSLTNHVFPFA